MKNKILVSLFFGIFICHHSSQATSLNQMRFGIDFELGKYARPPIIDEYIHTYALGGGVFYEYRFFTNFFGLRPIFSGLMIKAEDFTKSLYEGTILTGLDFVLYPFIQSFTFNRFSVSLGIYSEIYFNNIKVNSYPSLAAGIEYETSIGIYMAIKYFNGLNIESYYKPKQRFITSFINFYVGYNIASIFYNSNNEIKD